jgi:hypothetical protein
VTAQDKQIMELCASRGARGRYVIAPPDVPADIAAALCTGLLAMMKDEEFLAEASKAEIDVEPARHSDLEAVVQPTLPVSDRIRQKVREIFK